MSNYPPGVTGNEYAISGPEREWEEDRFCDECEKDTRHTCQAHRDHGAWANCNECGQETDITDELETGPDPDEAYDRMRERDL